MKKTSIAVVIVAAAIFLAIYCRQDKMGPQVILSQEVAEFVVEQPPISPSPKAVTFTAKLAGIDYVDSANTNK